MCNYCLWPGTRTIGVITKLDLMDDGTDARCIIVAVHIFAVVGAVNHGRTCGTPVRHIVGKMVHGDDAAPPAASMTQRLPEKPDPATIEGQPGHAATHGLYPPRP